MDWMSEKIDLSDFDLDSLMGSCSPDQAPSSPETLLLDPHMDLDLDLDMELLPPPLPPPPAQESPKTPTEMKSEPASPLSPPSPPLLTLELGSEVDVSVAEKPPATTSAAVAVAAATLPTPPPSDSDSDSGIESSASSPARAPSPPAAASSSSSSRTKPYAKPASAGAKPPRAPRVAERKIKKMEQNKTAATRYRQKKRVEQELLNEECQELERRNRQLADRADSISREIQYLRDLMEEVRKHRRGRGAAPQEDPAAAAASALP